MKREKKLRLIENHNLGWKQSVTSTSMQSHSSQPGYTPYQAKYFAHFLTREGVNEGEGLTQSLSAARVDLNPHQVDAALFALRSPLSKGVLLADEVGLGKTIEAALVMAQRWWERKRRILLITPASLRKQWAQELREKFSLPSTILDTKVMKDLAKAGETSPLGAGQAVNILSYEYAARISSELATISWDLVVFDEAHKLRNVYKSAENSRAARLRDALVGRQKLLLTATPLQNNLMELFGLVSIIDDAFFGSPDAFRAEFASREDRASHNVLGRRLAPLCKRTLRRQVQKAGLINYTNRLPKTFDFTPDQLEVDLYNHMSAYLQQEGTLAVGRNGRHLVILVLRKILGSSSFAIAATLDKMVARLERKLPVDQAALDDIDGVAETADEWREAGHDSEADGLEADAEATADEIDPEQLKAEIAELKRYRDLAASIQTNAKGKALLDSLPKVLSEIVAKPGGKRKAVIFTESVRTQTYLRELLEANGFAGETVVLNGANSDADSKAIYKTWMERHRGTEAISGSKSADMKAAIVEAFRDDRSILIATESGAEGINLQFCSLLINYDLPWNPQRVEQRIGRCHRYGQMLDVTVVNFMNRKNQAEERIVQLLESKFRLFEGVFGSSDEVLGAIESGVDIERRILAIVQSCRGNDAINAAFDELQLELALEIDEAKTSARDQILAAMDDKVVQRLKLQKGAYSQSLDDFKRALLRLARAELPDAHFHADHAERFDHNGQTFTTEWPLADDRGWTFFRLGDGRLADDLVRQSKARDLATAALNFDLSAYAGHLSDVESLKGLNGWMQVARLTLKTPARTYDNLVFAAMASDGGTIDPEIAERLLQIPATVEPLTETPPVDLLATIMGERQIALVVQAQNRLGGFLEEEEERLDNWQEDARVSYEAQIKALNKEAKEKAKLSRAVQALDEKIALQKEAAGLKRQVDELHHQLHTRLREISDERDRMLDEIAGKLSLTPNLEPLFIVRWSLA